MMTLMMFARRRAPARIGLSLLGSVLAAFWVLPVSAEDSRSLLIVVDGLRPDYITEEHTPNLYELGGRGVFGDTHSAVFPSVTRANSPSISTGSYPRRHGILHNTMWVPEMDEPFSTGRARSDLRRFGEAIDGDMVTAVSLGEMLEAAGQRLFVVGSGGSGNTLLQNHLGKGMGIWTARGYFVPSAARDEAVEAVGEPPGENPEMTAWAIDAYLHKALSDDPPEVTLMWINEPDSAGHSHGVGAPETLKAVSHVDEHIGRLLRAHEEHGLTDRINIFVTSDHGFTTSTGRFHVGNTVRDSGFGEDDVRVVSNMIYLNRDDPELLEKVVEALQRDDQIGNVYTRPDRPGSYDGIVEGTISTAAIQWDHERSADAIVAPAWTDDVNEFGFAGVTTRRGTATHGSDSPFDLQIRLVAAGPDIKRGLRSSVPTGNVDFAPTILHLHGIEPDPGMDGRVLHELLRGGPDPESVQVDEHTRRAAVRFPDGFEYVSELDMLRVDETIYLRGARTRRSD